MRSSVACLKCRRSKVRCVNNGPGTTCKNCELANRICDYTTAGSGASSTTNASHRRESMIASQSDQPGADTPNRKRKKTIAPSSGLARFKDGSPSTDDALDSPLLTPKVWRDLFDIFEKHFATDFPFLHRKTFLDPLLQAGLKSPADPSTLVKSETPSSVRPPHTPQLLLAFLTLTARFHPVLVARHANPRATAEYYAGLGRKHLGPDVLKEPTMENTQALLMLGFHDWGNLQGARAWITIGTAIRCAQALGYHCDPDLDDMQEGVTHPSLNTKDLPEKDRFLIQEKERRTLWSCFIMDRYLSSGKYRLHMLNAQDLQQQLPCSDSAFNHGRKVKTRMLREDDATYANRRKGQPTSHGYNVGNDATGSAPMHIDQDVRWEVDEQESMLSRYIQVMEIYGDVMKWTCAGGRRRQSQAPPWEVDSPFRNLEDRLKKLKQSLPDDLQLNPSNTADHIHAQSSRTFVLLHAVITLCTIALYREYMAFLPFKLERPQGPLDEPKFDGLLPEDKPDYWVNQARECFKAAKDFSDLLQECRKWELLVETPISGFTAYTVAFCDVYCFFFPKMDPDGYLNHQRTQPDAGHVSMDVIIHMKERLEMPWKWRFMLLKLHRFIRRMRKEFKELGDSPGSTTSSTDSQHRKLADGGGGLYEYLSFERDHKEIGDIKKDYTEKDMDEYRHNQDLEDLSEAASPAPAFNNVEKTETEELPSSVPSQFHAVNSNAVTPKPEATNGTYTLPMNGHPNAYNPHVSGTQHSYAGPAASQSGYNPYASPSRNDHGHSVMYPLPAESAQRASLQLHQVQQGQAESTQFGGQDWQTSAMAPSTEPPATEAQKQQFLSTYGTMPIQALDYVEFAHGQNEAYGLDSINTSHGYSNIYPHWLSAVQFHQYQS